MKRKIWLTVLFVVATTIPLWVGAQAAPTDFCWNPSPSTDVAGYRLYKCGGTPCTKIVGVLLKDVAKGALTTRTDSVGMVCTAIPAASEGYATVTAYDTSQNESVSDGTTDFFDLN